MRKFLMSVMALALFLVISTVAVNAADAPAACTAEQKTLVFHYLRFDQNYEKVGMHLWNTGGTSDTVLKSGVDDFGAFVNICIGNINAVEGKYTIGSIPLYDATAGDNRWNTKDTLDAKDLMLDVTYLFTPKTQGGTDTPTTMHVYFLQGSDSVVQIDDSFNNILVLYADESNLYDGFGIHTWDRGTNVPDTSWSDPLLPADTGYTNKKFPVQLFVIKVADDAKENIGFIMHKGDTKSWSSDIFIPSATVKANKTQVLYYLFGGENVTTKDDFTTKVATFSPEEFGFKPFDIETLKGTYAPDPGVIKVEFNQSITITKDSTTVFKPEFFTLKQGETEIGITVSYLPNKATVTEFVVAFEDENFKLDPTQTYTIYFDNGLTGSELQKSEIEVDMDLVKPEITVVGGTTIEITQYEEFEFPDFVATDDRDGIITNKVYVPTGKGKLDTAKVGEQVITLSVLDQWGNQTDVDLTIKINLAPAQEAKISTSLIIGIVVGVVAIVGAAGVVVLRKKA